MRVCATCAVTCFVLQRDATRYVRFKDHRDALRCIEALTPTDPEEADGEKDQRSNDLRFLPLSNYILKHLGLDTIPRTGEQQGET